MIKSLLFSAIVLVSSIQITKADNHKINPIDKKQINVDSLRLVELDQYWTELSRTVREGDYDSYKAAYHEDAVIVFAAGKNKTSVSISEALAGWKQGFHDTKTGKNQNSVVFRFSQRIGNETTAHETGIFLYTSTDSKGKVLGKSYTHFEMLFVKLDNVWYALMEYQKSNGTLDEWKALK